MAVVQQPVQHRRCDDRAAQQFSPLAEALVGRQDNPVALVPMTRTYERIAPSSVGVGMTMVKLKASLPRSVPMETTVAD